MTDTMPTPRCDARNSHAIRIGDVTYRIDDSISRDFARQLEKELSVAIDALNWISDMDPNGRPVRDELDMFNVAGKTVQAIEKMRRKWEENK
jgi:hypothetical protein